MTKILKFLMALTLGSLSLSNSLAQNVSTDILANARIILTAG